MSLDKKLIGIRIMQRRKGMGLTQEQLAELLNISKNHLSSIERGLYVPTTQLVLKICETLGETPDYYLIGKITPESNATMKLLQRMPPTTQKLVLRLLEVYLEMISES